MTDEHSKKRKVVNTAAMVAAGVGAAALGFVGYRGAVDVYASYSIGAMQRQQASDTIASEARKVLLAEAGRAALEEESLASWNKPKTKGGR